MDDLWMRTPWYRRAEASWGLRSLCILGQCVLVQFEFISILNEESPPLKLVASTSPPCLCTPRTVLRTLLTGLYSVYAAF